MTTTFLEAKNEFISILSNRMQIENISLAIENVPFDTKEVNEFVRISFNEVSKRRLTNDNGTAIYQNEGIIAIQIFTAVNIGFKRISEIEQIIFEVFENYSNDNLRTLEFNYNNVGIADGWQQKNININFEFDTLI